MNFWLQRKTKNNRGLGLYEETVFRVIINDAILYKFRNSKYVFVWIAVISSLVFGADT